MDAAQPQVKASYSEIGTLMRQARESARLSLDQASRLLHIRVRYLEAMEQGDLEELPGLPYIRGYIQTYAAFLGLDKTEIMRRFDAIERALRSDNIYFPQVLSKEKTATPRMVWVGLGIALGIYLLWLAGTSTSNKTISVVDAAPRHVWMQVSAELAQDVSCLKQQDGLYPPCILVKEPEFRAPPLDKQVRSVMEMAILQLAIPDQTSKTDSERKPKEPETDEESVEDEE
jgi:transcriptional regulator with XRE-family HTH domain